MDKIKRKDKDVDLNDGQQRKEIRPMHPIIAPELRVHRTVDLREWMSPIEQQGDMNTCSANAAAGICEYLIRRRFNQKRDVSRLFIYYNAQIISQRTHRVIDQGVAQRDIISSLRKYGVCDEQLWAYKKKNLCVEPPAHVYYEASRLTIVPLRIPCDIKSIEICLHRQMPILADIVLIDGTGRSVETNHGYLAMPNLNNSLIGKTAFHAVVIVGYNQDTKHFLVRNSWGGNWGYKGYFYLPYEYLSHQRLFNRQDGLWTIMNIVPRTEKLPDVHQLVSPSHHQHHHHHHRH